MAIQLLEFRLEKSKYIRQKNSRTGTATLNFSLMNLMQRLSRTWLATNTAINVAHGGGRYYF